MALPQTITDFLSESATNAGVSPPTNGDDLFKTGVLDSFALVDFVAVLETECHIKVPDSDVVPANFQTLQAIENYVQSHQS
jgi:acyl carrier protein